MTKKRGVPILLVLACVLYHAADTRADPRSFNGTWTLNQEGSQTFEGAGKERNKSLLAKVRLKRAKELDPKYHERDSAAEHRQSVELLSDDERPATWIAMDEVAPLLEAESIKLYFARKIAILYGAERKRLLTLNASGRSYTVSGSTLTKDDIGTSLAYLEGGAMVIETDTRWGERLVERFELNETSEHLLVTVRMQQIAKGPWLEFERVFDRSD